MKMTELLPLKVYPFTLRYMYMGARPCFSPITFVTFLSASLQILSLKNRPLFRKDYVIQESN